MMMCWDRRELVTDKVGWSDLFEGDELHHRVTVELEVAMPSSWEQRDQRS